MDIQTSIVVSFTIYKIASLATGMAFSYLGYRLFMAGIWGDAGHLDTRLKDAKLVLRGAAPGTFFAVLGAVIVVTALIQGAHFFSTQDGSILSDKPNLP